MPSRNDNQHPVDRVAAGVKTALFVCVIGFIALMANRSLVAPGGASSVEAAPAVPSMIAPDVRTPTIMPADDAATATPPAPSDDAKSAQNDGSDNHPSSF